MRVESDPAGSGHCEARRQASVRIFKLHKAQPGSFPVNHYGSLWRRGIISVCSGSKGLGFPSDGCDQYLNEPQPLTKANSRLRAVLKRRPREEMNYVDNMSVSSYVNGGAMATYPVLIQPPPHLGCKRGQGCSRKDQSCSNSGMEASLIFSPSLRSPLIAFYYGNRGPTCLYNR